MEQGQDAVFICGVEGKPSPSVFWSIEGNHSLLFPGESSGRLIASSTPEGHTTLTVQVEWNGSVILLFQTVYYQFTFHVYFQLSDVNVCNKVNCLNIITMLNTTISFSTENTIIII